MLVPPSCSAYASDGSDAVYAVQLAADEVLSATVEATRYLQPVLYVMSDCQNPYSSCETADSPGRYEASVQYASANTETVYLVVDSSYTPQDGRYMLDIAIEPAQCQPGQTRCSSTPNELEYCGQNRLWESYTCQGGCAGGSCTTPSGGICYDAVMVSDGQTVSGDWSGTNDLEIRPTEPGECQFAAEGGAPNSDTFYRIDLNRGDLLEVDLQTNERDARLLFLPDCTTPDQCRLGISEYPSGPASYFAETAGPVWVMVDAARNASLDGNYQLSFEVTPSASCAPGQAWCLDANTVAICDDQGSGARTTYACPSGCARGGCQADANLVDTCQTAPNIGDGILSYVGGAPLSDDISFSSSSCTPSASSRADLIYEVTVDPGEVLHAASDVADLSIIGTCTDPAGTCIGTDDPNFVAHLGEDELFWAPTQTRTVHVVADVGVRPGRLLIEKLPMECSAGTRRCAPEGNAVEVCSAYGRWKRQACQSGCTASRCDVPSGETCEDPIRLAAGQSVAGSFDDAAGDIHTYGSECWGNAGPDTVYELDLNAGDLLSAKLLAEAPKASMYVLADCARPASDACLQGSRGERHLDFVAPSTGSYYLVVDASDWQVWGDYLLQVDVAPGSTCRPNTTKCDASTGRVSRCNDDGTGFVRTYQCARGCQDDRGCAPPSTLQDTCASALRVGNGTILSESFGNFRDDYGSPSFCGVNAVEGYESVYEVPLSAGEVLRANLESNVTPNSALSPLLFVTSDCSGASSTCLAKSQGDRSDAQVTYWSQAGETVYLVADAQAHSTADFTLEIDTFSAECTPGSARCVDAQTLETCPSGVSETRVCPNGCTSGACAAAANDTCNGATPLARDGDFHAYDLRLNDDYGDGQDLSTASSAACSATSTSGPDALYRLSAQAGDVITVMWTGAPEVVAWLSSDCAQAAANCADVSSTGTLTHTIPASGDYWLVVDSLASGVRDKVQLDVRVEPKVCQPGTAFCSAEPGFITYCNAHGTHFEDYVCAGSCGTSSGRAKCAQPRGEQCVDAIDATGGGTFLADISSMDSTFLHRSNSCVVGSTMGGDAIYRVDLTAGQTLDATVTPDNNGDAVVYVLDDCVTTAPETSCLTGTTSYIGRTATMSYIASADETVYLVVDSSPSWPTEIPWLVEIDIR